MRYADTFTRVRAPLVTGYGGQKVRDWGNAARVENIPGEIQFERSIEYVDGRQVTVSRWNLFAVPDADVVATDRIEQHGNTFEVDGEVGLLRRRGVPHHIEAVLRKVAAG